MKNLFSLLFQPLLFSVLSLSSTSLFASDIFKNRASNNNEITQDLLDSSPEVNKKSLNNKSAIDFDGNNDFLNYKGKQIVDKNYTIFVVEKRKSGKSNNYFFGTSLTSPQENEGLILGYKTDTQLLFGQGSNEELIEVEPYSKSNPAVLHVFVHSESRGKEYYHNGNLIFQNTANTASLVSNDNAYIGRNGNDYYNGIIAETAIYKRDLSPNKINDISKYLANKWNITISNAKSCGPDSPGYVKIDNGEWSNSGYAKNRKSVSITCINGTQEVGEIEDLTCKKGVYSGGSGGSCSYLNCGDPNSSNALPNGVWNSTSAQNGDTIVGTCNSGYTGSPTITCNAGIYDSQQGSCELLYCPQYQYYRSGWTYSHGQVAATNNSCVGVSASSGVSAKYNKCCPDGRWYRTGGTLLGGIDASNFVTTGLGTTSLSTCNNSYICP